MKLPSNVREFFKRKGAKGGKARAANHTAKQLSAWGKLGGRPKGSGKKKKRG